MGKKANRKCGRSHWVKSEIFEKFAEIFLLINVCETVFLKFWLENFNRSIDLGIIIENQLICAGDT